MIVRHIYDKRAKGRVIAKQDKPRRDPIVWVAWDSDPHALHPCIRDELLTKNNEPLPEGNYGVA